MVLKMARVAVLVVLVVAFGSSPSEAMIHYYDGTALAVNDLTWLLVGLYKEPGSHVDLNVTIQRLNTLRRGHIESLVVHIDDLAYVGVHMAYNLLLCCDEDVYEANACTKEQVGFTILTSNALRHMRYDLIEFAPNEYRQQLQFRHPVSREGLHYIILVNCNGSNAGLVEIQGTATWVNSLGYLTGSDYFLIPSNASLAILYTLALAGWITLILWRRAYFMLVHHAGVAIVLLLGALAHLLAAVDLSARNDSGYICIECTVVASFFEAAHATSMRLVFLLIALGLGVTVPIAGGVESPRARLALLALPCGYFSLSFVQSIMGGISDIPDSSGRQVLLLMLPINILNSCFYVWIFLELVRTIHGVRDDGDREKFSKYLAHLILFLSLTGLGIFVAVIQMVVQWRNVSDITWTFQWAFVAGWDLVVFIVLAMVASFWWPGQYNHAMVFRQRGPLEWRPQQAVADPPAAAGPGMIGAIEE